MRNNLRFLTNTSWHQLCQLVRLHLMDEDELAELRLFNKLAAKACSRIVLREIHGH